MQRNRVNRQQFYFLLQRALMIIYLHTHFTYMSKELENNSNWEIGVIEPHSLLDYLCTGEESSRRRSRQSCFYQCVRWREKWVMTGDRELRWQLFDGGTAGGRSTRETSNVKEDATRWRNTKQHTHTLRMSETPRELEVGSLLKWKVDHFIRFSLLCSHGNDVHVIVFVARTG